MVLDFLRENRDYLAFCLVSLLSWGAIAAIVSRRRLSPRIIGLAASGFALCTVIGWLVVDFAADREQENRRTLLAGLAPTYAEELEHHGHAQLGLETPADDPLYLSLIEMQAGWLRVNPSVHDIYTFRRDADGVVRIIVDSETDYNHDGKIEGDLEARTAIGELYDPIDPALDRAFAGTLGFTSQPTTDRWGCWFSAYAPLHDNAGRTDAVVGVDYSAAEWTVAVARVRWVAIGLLFVSELVLLSSATSIVLLRRGIAAREAARRELARERQKLEDLVAERTQSLLQAERQLFQQEKLASLGTLAAGVAHEINTPIQFIGDNLRALAENFEDLAAMDREYRKLVDLVRAGGPVEEALADVTRAAGEHDVDFVLDDAPKAIAQSVEGVGRVAGIVRTMKEFAHVDQGERKLIDLNQGLQSTLTVARNEFKYVADLQTDFGELPLIEACGGELNQVFLNLIVNAAHAIADTRKRGRITVSTRAGKDSVEVSIADTGLGIPEGVRHKVFDPFFTTKEVGKGTGQGLAIAHSIVVGKHGGTIDFDTEVGVGTTFRLRLPVHSASPPPE